MSHYIYAPIGASRDADLVAQHTMQGSGFALGSDFAPALAFPLLRFAHFRAARLDGQDGIKC